MNRTDSHDTLGDGVVPSRYRISIEPDFESFQYEGSVSIDVEAGKSSREIALNASELRIHKASVTDRHGTQEASVREDKKRERLRLLLKRPVKGRASVDISFGGTHNDKMYGFYRSRYMQDGAERYMLTTQFEAASARKAFPCFDEPSFKALFDLSLVVGSRMTCVSNMPVKEEHGAGGGKKVVTFHTSPKMSTYLLYIGTGELSRITGRYRDIELGVVTTPGKERYAKLALDYAARFLAFFEKYFGIKYPLPKMDLIAVPDFSAGAMENWGAVTFRETALLGDERSAVSTKQRIAEVIAHEFVHQWFGDLVTMKWWNDLWLNESFANFMSYKAMDAVMPEWDMMTQYIAGVVGAAFAVDQLASTHPISVKVSTPAEIDQIFDEISYNKGGAVLSMIEGYVGKETFRKGLHEYLSRHAYSNAEKYDLWNAIGKIANRKGGRLMVPEVAASWIDNKGYPAIRVMKENGAMSLSQERFMVLGRDTKTKWLVPIGISYPPKAKEERLLMKSGAARCRMKGGQPKLNPGQTGFYRTIYPTEMLDNLGEMIKSAELDGRDAWGIENDMYALTKKMTYTLGDYLSFVDKYCFAAKYPLNTNVLMHLRGLLTLFYGEDERIYGRIRELLRSYSSEIVKEVGWKRARDETTTTTLMRSSAILASGISGEKMTLNKANRMFGEMDDRHQIDPNLRTTVYGLVAWSGNGDTYRELRGRYERETQPDEKIRMLVSLGMFSDRRILGEALDYSLSGSVRYQDSFYIPAYVSFNPHGKSIIWDWTRKNWKPLMQRFRIGTHMLDRYVENAGASGDRRTMKELRTFFSDKGNMRSDIRSGLDKTLETMEVNARFLEYNKKVGIAED